MTEKEQNKSQEVQSQEGQVDLNLVLASMRDQIGLLSQEKAILYAQVMELQDQMRIMGSVLAAREPKSHNE